MKKMFILTMLLFAAGSVFGATAEEPFEGTIGEDVVGSTGGDGWGGPWALNEGVAGSFLYSDGMTFADLETSGLKVVFDPGTSTTRHNRPLAAAITVDGTNTEAWACALIEIGSGDGDINSGRGIGVELTNAVVPVVGFGKKLNSSYGVGAALTDTWVNSTVAANTVGVRFVVLKLAFDGTDTVATVYVATDGDTIDIDDPTTFTGTASITLTGAVTFDGVNLYAYHGGTTSNAIDEIRVANTYAELLSGSTATSPTPGNNKDLIDRATDLSWEAPGDVVPESYTLYLRADDPNFVAGGNIVDGVTETSPFTPAALFDFKTTYYWRVDVVTVAETFEGSVWSFTTAPEAPVITLDPVSQTVAPGATVVLTIEYQNATSFQWYKNGVEMPDKEADTLIIDNVQESDEGLYTCDAIGAGTVTSEAARLMTERLVGHWTFDDTLAEEVGGLTAVAVDPNTANDIDPVIGYGADEDAVVGSGSLSLDNGEGSEGGWLTVPGTAELYNFYPQGLTVSSWIKTTASGVYDDIVSKNIDDGASRWFMRIAGTNGLFRMGPAGAWTNGAINDGEWHLMVTTYDPETGIAQVYLDGVAKGSASMSPTAEGNLAQIAIGGSEVSVDQAWTGFIDDVKIYSYALDAVDVAFEYTTITNTTLCLDGEGLEFDVAGPTVDPETGDPVPDCRVDIYDFAAFASTWLNCREVPTCIP